MTAKTKLATTLTISIMAIAVLATTLPQAQAAAVKINVTASGYGAYTGDLISVDGTTNVGTYNLGKSFSWKENEKHTLTATQSVYAWPNTYNFLHWTDSSGAVVSTSRVLSYTVTASSTTLTACYAKSTYSVNFTVSGLSNVDTTVITIDGTPYIYPDIGNAKFLWTPGINHTVTATSIVTNDDTPSKTYNFLGWTNGNGLTTTSSTFTMPASDVVVTANFAQSSVGVTFRTQGLSNLNSDVILTIDGNTYDYWQVANTNFQWVVGSNHTVTATSSVKGYDGVVHYFNSWSNGNGLTTNSGNFTTPSSNVAVTITYDTTAVSTTTLTVTYNTDSADKGTTVTVSGTLTSDSVGVSGKTITLTYYNGTTWCSVGTTTTGVSGSYSYAWNIPSNLENGVYPLKADFAGDISYQDSSASTGTSGNGVSLQVLPESWGSIIALGACFGGTVVFFKLRSKDASKKA